MEIVKIIAIALLTCIASLILKQLKPEFSMLINLIGGVVILLMVITYCGSIFSVFNDLIIKSGVDQGLFSIILKIIGIGYLVEFSAGICNDCGCSSIADKVMLAGKITILFLALPIINSIINIIMEILP